MKDHYEVLICGGGTAGLTVAAQLRSTESPPSIGIIEPSTKHYYQPLWTLVGGGIFPREDSVRDEKDYIPSGADWIQASVSQIEPDANSVLIGDGARISYDHLVIALGIQVDWGAIRGLRDCVGRVETGVCSNYAYETVASTWELIRTFKGGRAVFTEPTTPVKCGGAPQKIMYLAEDHFRRSGIRDRCEVIFCNGKASIFSSPYYAAALLDIVEKRGMEVRYKTNLVELRAASREAVFRDIDGGVETPLRYDMIHVTPPMSAPPIIKQSGLADAAGWVDVDKNTLRHSRLANIWSLGDCSSLPTSKTGAAIRKQAPTVVDGILAARGRRPARQTYDGYTSCPLVTGYGKLILAEFDYSKEPCESFPFDQRQERYSMYALKAYGLPQMYWHGMLKGRM